MYFVTLILHILAVVQLGLGLVLGSQAGGGPGGRGAGRCGGPGFMRGGVGGWRSLSDG